jgi:hypothetical protein
MKVGQKLAIVTHADDGHVGTLKNDATSTLGILSIGLANSAIAT